MNKFACTLILGAFFLTSRALAQQTVPFSETGISVDLPATWTQVKTWSLTDNMPAVALHHLQNQSTGQFIAVHREHCPDAARRRAWSEGSLAAKQLDYRVDSLAPLSGQSAVASADGSGFVTVAARESVVYMSYAFFQVKGTVCYRVEVGGPKELFEASSAVYQGLLDGLVLPE